MQQGKKRRLFGIGVNNESRQFSCCKGFAKEARLNDAKGLRAVEESQNRSGNKKQITKMNSLYSMCGNVDQVAYTQFQENIINILLTSKLAFLAIGYN